MLHVTLYPHRCLLCFLYNRNAWRICTAECSGSAQRLLKKTRLPFISSRKLLRTSCPRQKMYKGGMKMASRDDYKCLDFLLFVFSKCSDLKTTEKWSYTFGLDKLWKNIKWVNTFLQIWMIKKDSKLLFFFSVVVYVCVFPYDCVLSFYINVHSKA